MTRLQRLRQLCLLTAPAFLVLVACSAPAQINLLVTNDSDQDYVVETASDDTQRLGTLKAHRTVTFERAEAWRGRQLVLRPAKGKPIQGRFTNPQPGCGCGSQPDLSLPVQVRADGSLAIGEPSETR